MISWFKKHFIPHEGNNHRPCFLDKGSIRNIILIILIVEAITFLIPTITHLNRTGNMAAVLSFVLSDLTNEERQNQKLPALIVNPILERAAELKAKDMATKGYFAHVSPEGKSPWYFFDQAGYQYQSAGENLAINFTDSKDITNAWMASPKHRENIMKGKYTEIGTALATGMYQGRETIFVVQLYGSPKITAVAENKKIAPNLPKKEVAVIPNIQKTENVLGEEAIIDNLVVEENQTAEVQIENTLQNQKPTFFQKLFASPRNATNKILLVIFGVMILALFLNIFIKIKHHHPDLITNGLVILAILGAIFITNNYFSKAPMVVLENAEYESVEI